MSPNCSLSLELEDSNPISIYQVWCSGPNCSLSLELEDSNPISIYQVWCSGPNCSLSLELEDSNPISTYQVWCSGPNCSLSLELEDSNPISIYQVWCSGLPWCSITPSLAVEGSAVENLLSGQTLTEILNICGDLDLKYSTPIFSLDPLTYNDLPPN